MIAKQPISRVVDLLDPSRNVIHGMSIEDARRVVARGDPHEIATIDGQFAMLARDGVTVRMARTIGKLMRYFIAKQADGPILIVADRIDAIHHWLESHGLADQFHPTYTRMVPAHYLVNLQLIGCPDPNPTYQRFFTPTRGTLPADLDVIGERYIRAAYDEIAKWLQRLPDRAPVGVCFSGGIDSGSVLLMTHHAMLSMGMSPSRLKAFTLSVDGGGADLEQARAFVEAVDLAFLLEPIEATRDDIDVAGAIRIIEDYKPLDVQSGAVAAALCKGIRQRYPDWEYLLDGEGGDENLKDYPIEENPELTVRSVLNNPLLYQEGWGVEAIKHSLTYSGGQSRGYARTYAPTTHYGFTTLSPLVAPRVIAVAEAVPFVELTDWDHDRLYDLKGSIVSRGLRAVCDVDMPVFQKRRFQHGVLSDDAFADIFPSDASAYRRMFHAPYEHADHANVGPVDS